MARKRNEIGCSKNEEKLGGLVRDVVIRVGRSEVVWWYWVEEEEGEIEVGGVKYGMYVMRRKEKEMYLDIRNQRKVGRK